MLWPGWRGCGNRLILNLFLCAWAAGAATAGEAPATREFHLPGLNGEMRSSAEFADRVILVNFWATWCVPCRREMPALNRLHQRLSGEGFSVIGIHVGPDAGLVADFLKKVPVEFPLLFDENMTLSGWGVVGLPTTFLIGPRGETLASYVGEKAWDSDAMVTELQTLIAPIHVR
ncbi:MAG: TlpA family protein disulfide reductase [Gammaproteobacteria bacterium]|nr:TlpA family protein disulfide reductase [Gammaproteobacteria bacterium]